MGEDGELTDQIHATNLNFDKKIKKKLEKSTSNSHSIPLDPRKHKISQQKNEKTCCK